MAERLPFGQLTPSARPIGAFISPEQSNTAGAARPSEMPSSNLNIQAIQRQNGGNVAGHNQGIEIAQALEPFNRGLTNLLTNGFVMLKENQIESGYYDELKNQAARATMSWQYQQEAGAANAAGQITQLEKVDPEAAYVMKQSNPWDGIGRRRALAQLAGGDIDNALAADLENNSGVLSAIQPGSEELARRKVDATQKILSYYGLDGGESEVAVYVTPKLNKAWDDYTEKHNKLYREELKNSTIANSTAAMGQALVSMGKDGIPLSDGSVLAPTDERFPRLAAQVLTGELDKHLSVLGGNDKTQALKDIREQLQGFYGGLPIVGPALEEVRSGPALRVVVDEDGKRRVEPIPLDQRPKWFGTNPLDSIELKNKGNGARLQAFEHEQKGKENELDQLWWTEGMPGSMLPSDPRYPSALIQFRNAAGAKEYYNVDEYLKGRMDSLDAVAGQAYPSDPFAAEDFMGRVRDLPNSAFGSSAQVQALLEEAKTEARKEPTRELQSKRYAEFREEIRRRQVRAGEVTPGLQSAIDKALLQDLGLPQVKPIVDQAKAKAGSGSASGFQAAMTAGSGTLAAAQGLGSAQVSAFTQRLNNLYLRNAEAKIDAWMAERPGVPLTSSARNVLISEAFAETRKSDEYKQAFQELTGKKPGEPGSSAPRQNKGQLGADTRGVSREASGDLKDSTVRAYQARPVLNGEWLRGELVNISNGKPVSADLYRMANRAGTTTNRYLLEQLRFYPQLDPKGEIGRYLEDQVRRARVGREVSSANWQSVVGSLFGERPAAAATLPVASAARPPMPAALGGPVRTDAGGVGVTAPAARPSGGLAVVGETRPPSAPVLPAPTGGVVARGADLPAGVRPVFRSSNAAVADFNPVAPGSWLMSMIMPARPTMAMPSGVPSGGDGGGGWESGPAVAMSHADSGSGYTIPGMKDAQGRPPVFSRGGANAFAAMVRDSGGQVKASDIASSQRSAAKNRAVGGANGSHHLSGNAMDIHGTSEAWIRKNGAKYGWYVHDYDGSHGGHFEFRGGGSAAPSSRGGGDLDARASGYMRRLSYLETRLRNIPNAEGSPGRGYFQAFPAFSSEAIAASGGIDPRDGSYDRAAQASWAWIAKHNPRAADAIKRGDYDTADRLLRNTWPSLPGGSQAQSEQVQREARRYLGRS